MSIIAMSANIKPRDKRQLKPRPPVSEVVFRARRKAGAKVYAAMNALVLPNRQIFLVDTHVNVDPTPEQLAEITIMAAEEVRRFGIEPKVALVSHSNFGSS